MEVIIEEISRGHKLIGRHKFAQQTVSIGRGYHSDIILSDPHVCAEHLTIEFDGENWRIIDQDSINGCFLDEGKKPADGHIVRSGDIITLGKSQIRVVFPYHPVATSITLSPFENLINLAKHPVVLSVNILIFALLTGWIFYLNNPKEVNFTQLLVPAVGLSLIFAIWPAIVSLVSHLTKHDARIFTQLGICFIFYNLTWVSDFLEAFLQFNTSSASVLPTLSKLLPIVIAFCLFWLNGYIGFHLSKTRRIVIAASLTGLLFGGGFLVQLSKKPEFSIRPKFDSTLLTPDFLIAKSSTVEAFIEDSNKLFDKVEKKAKKDKE
ncbi:FHA domain-containing protein [Thalassotalea sp. G2M2-11]|uniref:FHA domain-containing protein n=1 Tax=Thalassotalea sp. G2M2-11 TaxID=2787627 RepID=UPI0019D126F6|nr:FHA domain-containing protein [Thalassotalea sp. G2M2-11]